MGWMNTIGGLLSQYVGGETKASAGQVEQHFDQAAQAAPGSVLAEGLAAAMRSDKTPEFGQLAARLFGNSGSNQQASMLNTLLTTGGPALLSGALSSGNLPGLSSILGGSGPRKLTPEEAARVPENEIQHLANRVEKRDSSIIDRVSQIYAEHPGVVKTLGSAALAITLGKIAENMKQR